MNNDEKLLLNEVEAATLLSMSKHFLRRDRISDRSAGIPFIRIGAAVRYRRVDLEAWIVEQTKNTALLPMIIGSDQEDRVAEQRRRGRPKKCRS
jgi:hypothetical protein